MKRAFRPQILTRQNVDYPRHVDRRSFLLHLGGAAATTALLASCGEEYSLGGVPDMGGAPIDTSPETMVSGGLPDAIPAPIDAGMPETTGGLPDAMPAPIDQGHDQRLEDGAVDGPQRPDSTPQ